MRIILLAIVASFAIPLGGAAQTTIGPGGGPMAPGASQPPGYIPGGAGPGGVQVAPGPAARGVNVERTSPGGTALAPGAAGRVSTAPSRVSTAPRVRAPVSLRGRSLAVSKKATVKKKKTAKTAKKKKAKSKPR
jgi:hypothetical protein